MKFRTDINGLRAFAVIFVVLFHFNISPWNGGFVGVDVFFVISGYLMTRIIVEGLGGGEFSVLGFYFSRCKRIIPPLIFLCFLLVIVGYFIIPPSEYAVLSKHAASSLTFVSNMIYYREAGYFDAASTYKWLLHTWSLSVEWQFYIVLPIILIFINKFFNKRFKLSLIVLFLLSFLLSLYLSSKNPSLSYFFFGSRAWEMIAGGLAYLYCRESISNKYKNKLIYFCLVVIVASSILITDAISWPGIFTLIPVFATMVIIIVNGDILALNNKLTQKVGLWSYSIYLYHWPVLVASGIFLEKRNTITNLLLVMISIFLGWVSYEVIENKKGVFFKFFSRPSVIFPAAIALTVVCFIILKSSGFPHHVHERVNLISSFSTDSNKSAKQCFVMNGPLSPECKFGPKKPDADVDLVIIGDSHAYATLSAVIDSNRDKSIVFIAESSCPAIPDIERIGRPDCGRFMKNAFESAKEKYTGASILVVTRFSQYLHGENGEAKDKVEFLFDNKTGGFSDFSTNLSKAIESLGSERKIFILSPVPDYPYDVIFYMSRKAMLNDDKDIRIDIKDHKLRSDRINKMLSEISKKNSNVKILNVDGYLCDESYCYGSKDGIPLYRDSNHLSETGNKILTPLFAEMWE
ncbi:acyltransferase family protein [Providencia stuartii]|uniref:acyltransferase family protein n=1 Tax=Providencia stuartii TaxID=588 RepID=UPI0034E3F97B